MSTIITRQGFNNLQRSVANVMGIGSGTFGYGQPVVSVEVAEEQSITNTVWNNMRTDLAKIYGHQTNQPIVNAPASTNKNPPNLQLIASSTEITNDVFTQYSNFISNVSNNRFAIATGQFTPNVSLVTVSRSTQWGGAVDIISTTVTVTFPGYTTGGLVVSGENHRRCFFNAGGSIQIRSDLLSFPSNQKNMSWNGIFVTAGTFSLRSNSSAITGALRSGSVLANTVGFHQLTTSNRLLLRQTAASNKYYDAKYQENNYIIEARLQGSNQIVFVIRYEDNDAGDRRGLGPAVDEEVTGTLRATVTCTQPTGSNVQVPAPTASASAIQ